MMWNEFMEIAGYEVTYEDYKNVIEPMYMATNLNKQEFVKCLDKKRFAVKPLKQIEKEMQKVATHLKDTCEHYTDFQAKDKLEELVKQYAKRVGAYTYGFTNRWTLDDRYCRGCTYPATVEFMTKNYHTFKTITLA